MGTEILQIVEVVSGAVAGLVVSWFSMRRSMRKLNLQQQHDATKHTLEVEANTQARADELYERVLRELQRSDHKYAELEKRYEKLAEECRKRDEEHSKKIQQLVQVLHQNGIAFQFEDE